MAEPEQTALPKQLCSIRISFPIDTDEEAIDYKKKIGNILAPIPTARIEFTLSTMPSRAEINAFRT